MEHDTVVTALLPTLGQRSEKCRAVLEARTEGVLLGDLLGRDSHDRVDDDDPRPGALGAPRAAPGLGPPRNTQSIRPPAILSRIFRLNSTGPFNAPFPFCNLLRMYTGEATRTAADLHLGRRRDVSG
jgi:hypothetical protein